MYLFLLSGFCMVEQGSAGFLQGDKRVVMPAMLGDSDFKEKLCL